MEVMKQYLPIATKKQIIETIRTNALEENEYGMKYIDSIVLGLITDLSLIQFYCEETLDDVDMDKLYEDGIVDYIRDQIPAREIKFIEDNALRLLKQEVESYNSIAGVLNRNIQILISRIPDEKGMNKILNKLPKVFEKMSPENLELIKNIANIDTPTAQPNREQGRSKDKSKDKATSITKEANITKPN